MSFRFDGIRLLFVNGVVNYLCVSFHETIVKILVVLVITSREHLLHTRLHGRPAAATGRDRQSKLDLIIHSGYTFCISYPQLCRVWPSNRSTTAELLAERTMCWMVDYSVSHLYFIHKVFCLLAARMDDVAVHVLRCIRFALNSLDNHFTSKNDVIVSNLPSRKNKKFRFLL